MDIWTRPYISQLQLLSLKALQQSCNDLVRLFSNCKAMPMRVQVDAVLVGCPHHVGGIVCQYATSRF